MASAKSTSIDNKTVPAILNHILELELAGVVRYLQYWLRAQPEGRRSRTRGPGSVSCLLAAVAGKDVRLEEYARKMIAEEEEHACEVEKMLRRG